MLAAALWSLVLVCTALNVVLLARNRHVEAPGGVGSHLGLEGAAALAYVAFATLGGGMAVQRRQSPVGWLFCGGALATAFSGFASEYVTYAVFSAPDWPMAEVAAWAGDVAWWAGAGAGLTFGILLFPDGRLPSPRWRPLAYLAGGSLVLLILLHALTPGPLYGEFSLADNPLAIDQARGVLRPARNLAWLLLAGNLVIATGAVLSRLRGARGSQRRQLGWLAAASLTTLVAVVSWAMTHSEREASPALVQGLLVLAVVGVPLAGGSFLVKAAALQRSLTRLVLAREAERRRIRRDLHDGLGPTLAAMRLQLQTARRLVSVDPDTAATMLGTLAEEVRQAMAEVQKIVEDLRPATLDQLGLVAALEDQAISFSSAGTVGQADDTFHVVIDAQGELGSLPAAVEVAAFRIVCEAVNNAHRHGRARTCRVCLTRSREALQIEVLDDGVGLPATCRAGVGLQSMRERAAELGGSLKVEASTEGGTLLSALLPVYG